METTIHVTPKCPIRTTMELVGGKWKMAILYQLKETSKRPSELKKSIPDISEKMLSQELHSLITSNMVVRKEYPGKKLHVEYSLTENGRRSLPLIDSFVEFAQSYQPD